MSFSNPSNAPRGQSTQGLVMGRVQSGKTTSFSMVSSLAADNGYKIIIQLLGTTNLLVDDNFKDVKKVLGLDGDNNLDWWYPLQVGAKGAGPNGVEYQTNEIVRAIGNKKGQLNQNRTSKILYIYCIKKDQQIDKLTKLIQDIRNKSKSIYLPILIIDDEVDSYSLHTKKNPWAKAPTYDSLEKLKKACGDVTYIGYTATSQALFLAHDNSFLRPEPYAVLEPGLGYVGNSDIFGETSHILTAQQKSFSKNKHHQAKYIDPMDYFGPITRDGEPKDYDLKKLRESLYEPILDFLISWSFNWLRVDNTDLKKKDKLEKQVMSMMLMPATTNSISGYTPTDLMDMVGPWVESELLLINSYLSSPTPNNRWDKNFNDIYNSKKANSPKNTYTPTLDESKDLIKQLLDGKAYQCATVNQGGAQKIEASNADAWFIIGGMKLSRGYVVPNLVTTWMPFQPSSLVSDTTEQRGRFFGYKKSYLDLISVYAQEKTIDLLKVYASIENHLFESVKEGAKKGKPFSSIDTNWVLFDSIFQLTSSAKNRTKKLKRITSSWHTSLHSPFVDKSGVIKKNIPFNDDIENFLSKQKMKKVADPKFGIKKQTAQDALFTRLKLDDVYASLLGQLNVSKNDAALRVIIHAIKTSRLNKGWDCDIVYFDKIDNRSISVHSNPKVGWFFNASGYNTGPSVAGRQSGYVGDDYLIFGNGKFDPRLMEFDKNNNTAFTIQIHKIKNIWDKEKKKGGKILLNDVFCIRIHTPWDKNNAYYVGNY